MLNPDLKKDIDIEIEKAEPILKDFLHSDYFRETMDLIFRVNRLNEEQSESVELETILYMLGISNHSEIADAVSVECGLENTATIKQVTNDVAVYILEKIKSVQMTESISANKEDSLGNSPVEQATIISGDNISGVNILNVEEKKISDPREVIRQNTSEVKTEIKKESISEIKKIPTLGDVYLEKIDEGDKIIKKEI